MGRSQNLDRLTDEQCKLLAYLMESPNMFWPRSYMVEVRLDDVDRNLLNGGDGLHVHAGSGSRCYTVNAGKDDWAIVHRDDEDVQGWDWKAMAEEGERLADIALEDVRDLT
jgi:hypothetical protein